MPTESTTTDQAVNEQHIAAAESRLRDVRQQRIDYEAAAERAAKQEKKLAAELDRLRGTPSKLPTVVPAK